MKKKIKQQAKNDIDAIFKRRETLKRKFQYQKERNYKNNTLSQRKM